MRISPVFRKETRDHGPRKDLNAGVEEGKEHDRHWAGVVLIESELPLRRPGV